MTAPPPVDRPALFLDFDGTLVDIAAEPQAVAVDPGLVPLLGRLHDDLEGAVAIVSGRTIADIDRYLAPLTLPAAGLHGLERRLSPGGAVERAVRSPAIDRLYTRLLMNGLLRGGVTLEDKGATLAIHYRAAPAQGPVVGLALERALKELSGLHLVHGKMVVEAKPTGTDKGTAMTALMALPPFAGRQPVFVGDDITDEDGFRAVQTAGGITVKVGEGPTVAEYRLADVAAVQAWLAGFAEAARRERSA